MGRLELRLFSFSVVKFFSDVVGHVGEFVGFHGSGSLLLLFRCFMKQVLEFWFLLLVTGCGIRLWVFEVAGMLDCGIFLHVELCSWYVQSCSWHVQAM
jgi:hypothetical protein